MKLTLKELGTPIHIDPFIVRHIDQVGGSSYVYLDGMIHKVKEDKKTIQKLRKKELRIK